MQFSRDKRSAGFAAMTTSARAAESGRNYEERGRCYNHNHSSVGSGARGRELGRCLELSVGEEGGMCVCERDKQA